MKINKNLYLVINQITNRFFFAPKPVETLYNLTAYNKMNLLFSFRGNLQILQQRFHHSLGRLQGLLEEVLLGTD
jgi:hypothetical protein